MQDKNLAHKKNLNTDNNISKTGYRALFLLMNLLKSPLSRDEILEVFKNDFIVQNSLSKDSVTNTVNALKKSGCIISRPTQRTKNKYILRYHPFKTYLNKDNVEALQTLRENIVTLGDWELLIKLNDLYGKFAYFVEDNEIKNILLYNHPLRNIDINLLKRLISYCKSKQFININYISSINGAEGLDFIPEYITLENEKLYLWGHNKKHNEFAYLRIDKINQVNAVFFIDENSKTETYKKEEIIVKYKLKGLSSMMYLAEIGEKIIEETPEEEYKLTIIATVSNKFSFLQKILSYGTDCLIISPDSIKKELLKKLEMMKSGYKDE